MGLTAGSIYYYDIASLSKVWTNYVIPFSAFKLASGSESLTASSISKLTLAFSYVYLAQDGTPSPTYMLPFSSDFSSAYVVEKTPRYYARDNVNFGIEIREKGAAWNTTAPIKNIPEMFSLADCTWSTAKENAIPWDHRLFIPDLVVINLGTNDDEYLLPLKEPEQKQECLAFEKAMRDFIDEIRQNYPGVSIIVTIGMIKVGLVSSLLKKVVSSYPDKVYFHEFSSLNVGGFMANGGHPNAAMHREAAEELSAFIASLSLAR